MLLCAWLNSSYEQMSGRSIGFHWLFPDTFCDFCLLLGHNASIEKVGGSFEFGFRLVSAVRARLPGQLVRGTSCRSVEVSELSAKKSEVHEALVPSFQACHGLSAGISSVGGKKPLNQLLIRVLKDLFVCPLWNSQSTRSALSHSVTCNCHILHKDLFGRTAMMWWGRRGRDECAILWTLRNDRNVLWWRAKTYTAHRKPLGLLRGHNLHRWYSPGLQSLVFTFNSPRFHPFFNLELIQIISSYFMIFHLVISFMLSYDIPGWRKCLSTSRAPNVVVKNVLAAPPGQGCQVGRFWEGLYMFKAEDLEVEDLIGFERIWCLQKCFQKSFHRFFHVLWGRLPEFTCWSRPNDLIDSSDVHHCIHRIHLNVLCCVIPGRWIRGALFRCGGLHETSNI